MDYEGKWYPVIKDEDNEILQFEYRLAKHLKRLFDSDQPERVSEKTSKDEAVLCSLWKHKESPRNEVVT